MAERTGVDRVAECVHVLRGIGVSAETIAAEHGLSGTDALAADLAAALPETTDPALYDCLHDTVARSDRGIECPRDHDLETAVGALSTALANYDCTLSVTDEGDELRIEATDAADDCRSTTVPRLHHLPDGDPLPLLAHGVDELLDGTGLTLALLTERDDLWRLALVRERRLNDLQRRLGVRLTAFGRPLLCADQPREFAEGTATAYATATDGGVAAATVGDPPPDDESVPSPSTDPDEVGAGRHEPDSPAPPVDEAALDRLVADLSTAFDAEPTDGSDRSEGADRTDGEDSSPDPTAVGGGPTRTVGESVEGIVRSVTNGSDGTGLDDAFAAVERAAEPDDAAGGSATGSDGLVGSPDRVVVDDDVEAALADVGVVDEAPDLDLDDALSSMAGEFDAAPPLPEPLAAATDAEASQ